MNYAEGVLEYSEDQAPEMPTVLVVITSNKTGKIKQGEFTAKQLVTKFLDEDELVQDLIDCKCQPIGETYVVDCRCDEEWENCRVEYVGQENEGR